MIRLTALTLLASATAAFAHPGHTGAHSTDIAAVGVGLAVIVLAVLAARRA